MEAVVHLLCCPQDNKHIVIIDNMKLVGFAVNRLTYQIIAGVCLRVWGVEEAICQYTLISPSPSILYHPLYSWNLVFAPAPLEESYYHSRDLEFLCMFVQP